MRTGLFERARQGDHAALTELIAVDGDRLPWRFSPMFVPLRHALAVLIAAVLIGGGIYLLGPRESGPGISVTTRPLAGRRRPSH